MSIFNIFPQSESNDFYLIFNKARKQSIVPFQNVQQLPIGFVDTLEELQKRVCELFLRHQDTLLLICVDAYPHSGLVAAHISPVPTNGFPCMQQLIYKGAITVQKFKDGEHISHLFSEMETMIADYSTGFSNLNEEEKWWDSWQVGDSLFPEGGQRSLQEIVELALNTVNATFDYHSN